MNRHDRKELENDIDEALDELEFDIDYSVNIYHELGTTIADIDLSDNLYDDDDDDDDDNSYDDDDDLPDDWDEKVEDAIRDVAFGWGGFISWNDWTLSISIPDDD